MYARNCNVIDRSVPVIMKTNFHSNDTAELQLSDRKFPFNKTIFVINLLDTRC